MKMDKKATAETLPPPPVEAEGYRVSWSGLSLTFDERTLNALVKRLVERIPDLKDLKIQVSSGELAATLAAESEGSLVRS